MNIIGVGIGVIEVEGAKFGNLAGNKINMNDIYGNAQFGILNESPTEVNATLNWWGDRSGPHHSISNPNGKGDRVSDNVLFKPCLTAPIEKVMGPTLKLSNLSISPTKAKINEAISISINLTNIGDLPATFTISLKVNGSIEAVRDIMLSGRECAVVTFKISKNVAGTYNVEVNGLNGTFNILKLSSSLSLSVSRKDLKKGEQVTVSGFINPPLAGIAVTLTFERPDGTNFTENVLTDINGSFTYAVTPEDVGKWSVHASWLGDENYEGTFSPSLSFTVMEKDALTPTPSPTPYPTPVPSPTYEAIPKWLIGVAIAIVIMIGIGVWAILKRKRK
jgi:hypothetical protein